MKKRTYIQPETATMILPKEALMGDITLSSSGSMATVGGGGAPKKRRTKVF